MHPLDTFSHEFSWGQHIALVPLDELEKSPRDALPIGRRIWLRRHGAYSISIQQQQEKKAPCAASGTPLIGRNQSIAEHIYRKSALEEIWGSLDVDVPCETFRIFLW
jgi:hypothetical protein